MNSYSIFHETEHFVYSHKYTKSPQLIPPLKMHAHNAYELLFIAEGNLNYTIEEYTFAVQKGDLIFIKPLTYHTFHSPAVGDYERYNVSFDKFLYDDEMLNEIFANDGKINLQSTSFIYQWAQRVDNVIKMYNEQDKNHLVKLLLDELIFWLKYNGNSIRSINDVSSSTALSTALDYINKNLFSLKSISQLAKNIFVSEPHLYALFRKHLNTTPKDYVLQKRMVYAERMILSGEKIKTVAETIGYSDYSVFYKAYKKYFGHSPCK